MGFFNRLKDFGDRELVRNHVCRISIGLEQIENETSTPNIIGLSIAVKQEVQAMMMVVSKLTNESINCLDVDVNGRNMLFPRFMEELKQKSAKIVSRGGYSII